MLEDGFALATSTVLDGRTVLRMCTINPRTTEADVELTVERIDALARSLSECICSTGIRKLLSVLPYGANACTVGKGRSRRYQSERKISK